MRFTTILASLVFYVSLSAAWPWPANLFIRDADGHLARRQDDNKSSSSAAPASTATSTSPAKTDSATGSGTASSAPSSTDKPSDSNNNDNKNSTTKATSSISITQAEAGGVSMLYPAATETTYYRIGENITWVWNYTSLAVTPSAVNVLVSCSSLGATYTLATNMAVGNATATMTWDTGMEATANPPPDTNKYTLAIYDAGDPAGPTQIVSPGKLGIWDQFTFSMYTSQPYLSVQDGKQRHFTKSYVGEKC